MGFLLGTANSALNKAFNRESSQSMDLLSDLDTSTAILSDSLNLLETLIKNAPDKDTVSEILVYAIASSSENTAAVDDLFTRVSKIKSDLVTNDELDIDFVAVSKSVGKIRGPKNFAHKLLKNMSNTSDALAVFNELSETLSDSEIKEILNDERLEKDFELGERLFVSAGRPQRLVYSGDSHLIHLDARSSFDPRGHSLNYQWYEIHEDSSESLIVNATSALSSVNIGTANYPNERMFMVKTEIPMMDVEDRPMSRIRFHDPITPSNCSQR